MHQRENLRLKYYYYYHLESISAYPLSNIFLLFIFANKFIAFVKFRNASQDERLSIITRMNLLELIELRAKSWQVSDGINTYYKTKASDVQVSYALLAVILKIRDLYIHFVSQSRIHSYYQ